MNLIVRQINAIGWHRSLIGLLVLWLIVLFISGFPPVGNRVPSSDSKTSVRLLRALADLEDLRKQNVELQEIFKEISIDNLQGDQKEAIENFQARLTKADHNVIKDDNYISSKDEPNVQYELIRRRIHSNTNELWFYIQNSLKNLKKGLSNDAPDVEETIKTILSLGGEHKRSLLFDIEKLAEVDGFSTWREKEANDLSNLVQERISYLQNPSDCKTAKKLVCNLNKGCGYGCQLHHIVYCFMVAYGTKRTMIMKSKGWRYHKAGWEEVFKPISDSCTDPTGESSSNWPGNTDTQVLTLPIIDSLFPRSPFLPLAVPEDLAPRLTRLHGDPIVWWVGQILKYLLRPQQKTAEMIQETMTKMGFKRPIVGVHVRRTDKVGTEAAFHGIEEYMAAVDEFYDQLELKQTVDQRRVYLASDEPKVITDAKKKYPNYEILGDPKISQTAAVPTRYSDSSLTGIINDIHMLSMSDYLVCTFSSQVCRVAYELMQNYFPDAASKFKSLDDIYYYGGQNAHNVIAELPHKPRKNTEMNIKKGDLIGIAGNHWNGFSKGRNLRTNQVALFPSFKVHNKIETAKFPTYSELDQIKNIDVK